MLRHYFQQLACADELGFGTGWILKLTFPPRHKNPAQNQSFLTGKVKSACARISLNSLESFRRTSSIEIGSAVVSILASGGPIAQAAERIANLLSLHGLDERKQENFTSVSQQAALSSWLALTALSRATPVEEAAWPALRGQIFMEAAEIFLRLLRGDVIQFRDDSTDRIDSRKFPKRRIGWPFRTLPWNLRHSLSVHRKSTSPLVMCLRT